MTPPVPLVERKRRQARNRIIQAAEELFFTRGFDDVSVSDIAERAEVGRTTFFRHFGDKQEVAFAREQELLETIAAAAQEDDFAPV
jgi:AcrR family transcriptional regulator